jgi:hypothetical protein
MLFMIEYTGVSRRLKGLLLPGTVRTLIRFDGVLYPMALCFFLTFYDFDLLLSEDEDVMILRKSLLHVY